MKCAAIVLKCSPVNSEHVSVLNVTVCQSRFLYNYSARQVMFFFCLSVKQITIVIRNLI